MPVAAVPAAGNRVHRRADGGRAESAWPRRRAEADSARLMRTPADVRRRDARGRQRDAPDQPHPPAGVSGPPAARRRGAHARRQLVELPAAQARRWTCPARTCSRRSTTTASPAPEGFGVQRLYTRDGALDETWTVRDGDAGARAPGLPPLRGRARLRLLLPERAGRDRRARWPPPTTRIWPGCGRRGRPLGRDPRVPLVGRARDVQVAAAPVSFGVFELTVGRATACRAGETLAAAMADAGYAGTRARAARLLRRRRPRCAALLGAHGLRLVGSFLPLRFSPPRAHRRGPAGLDAHARPARGGAPRRRPLPAVLLSDAFCEPDRDALRRAHRGAPGDLARRRSASRLLLDNVHRAAERCRERGFPVAFHYHAGTYVETPREIDAVRSRASTPSLLGLCFDTGHTRVRRRRPAGAAARATASSSPTCT